MAEVDVDELMADIGGLYGSERILVAADPAGGGEPAPTPRLIRCDRDQIRRVLLNLVDNALAAQKETGSEEPVVLAASPADRGASIALQVADRGPGVPFAERERIFEPDVTTKSDGMGLGLAIVLSTVEGHDGVVSVGDRQGGGALFTITLPLKPRAART
jgi:signal transduction histidine kinase